MEHKEKYRTGKGKDKTLFKVDIRYYPTVEIENDIRNEFYEYQLMFSYKNKWKQVWLKSLTRWSIFKAICRAVYGFYKDLKTDNKIIKSEIMTNDINKKMEIEMQEYNNFI